MKPRTWLCCLLTLVAGPGALPAAEPIPIVLNVAEVPGSTVIEGKAEGDLFVNSETSVLACGDFDGDGIEDIVFQGAGGTEAGEESEAFVLLGSADLPASIDLDEWPLWGIRLHATSHPPLPSAALGDLNCDGSSDLAFKQPLAGPGEAQAVILFGRMNPPESIDADTFSGWRTTRIFLDPSLLPDREPGSSRVASLAALAAGDLDGDGKRDLVVSSSRVIQDVVAPPEGLVYVVFGAGAWPEEIRLAEVGASLRGSRVRWRDESWGLIRPDGKKRYVGPAFGSLLLCADFDRDGMDDLVVQAPWWARPEGGFLPAVGVVFGRKDWPSGSDFLDVGNPMLPGACHIFAEGEDRILAADSFALAEDLAGLGGPDLLVWSSPLGCQVVEGDDPEACTFQFPAPPGLEGGVRVIPGPRIVPGVFRIDEIGEGWLVGAPLAAIGDWDGDGREDVAVGRRTASRGFPAASKETGAVDVYSGKEGFHGEIRLDRPVEGMVEILGPSFRSKMGMTLFGVDLDADGRREMIATAPGLPWIQQQMDLDGERRGRLYVFQGDVDFLGSLSGSEFVPASSPVAGGSVLKVLGNGLDARTEAFLGGTPLEIVERTDSRTLWARVPPAVAAGMVPLRLRRGGEEFVFAKEFEYYEGLIPRELDVDSIGGGGCTVVQRPFEVDGNTILFDMHTTGGEDFTGDGVADVLFANNQSEVLVAPGTIFLLHGSRKLPAELGTDELEDWATTFESHLDFEFVHLSALLPGDMTGDGVSELAAFTPGSGTIYIIFGGPIPTARLLLAEEAASRGCTITGCPSYSILNLVFQAGDVNGDGLMDLGFNVGNSEATTGPRTGSVVLVLGRRHFPATLNFQDLPRIYAKLPPPGGYGQSEREVNGAGDVDGDGFDDVALPSSCFGDGEVIVGEALSAWFLLFGRPEWPPESILDDEIAAGRACQFLDQTNTAVQGTVFAAGDQNGDGKDDLGVIDYRYPRGPSGPLRIVYGGTRARLASPRNIEADSGFDAVFPTDADLNEAIRYASGARDFDGDGWPEILLSDRHDMRGSTPPSRAIMFFGGDLDRRSGPLMEQRSFQLLSYHLNDLPQVWCAEYCYFPMNFYFAGDVNGDAWEDLVVMANGKVWIYFNPLVDRMDIFRRGDANGDGSADLADAIFTLVFLFLGDPQHLRCEDAADVDDDGMIGLSDAIDLLGYLFLSTPEELPFPGRFCGLDGTDAKPCVYTKCE